MQRLDERFNCWRARSSSTGDGRAAKQLIIAGPWCRVQLSSASSPHRPAHRRSRCVRLREVLNTTAPASALRPQRRQHCLSPATSAATAAPRACRSICPAAAPRCWRRPSNNMRTRLHPPAARLSRGVLTSDLPCVTVRIQLRTLSSGRCPECGTDVWRSTSRVRQHRRAQLPGFQRPVWVTGSCGRRGSCSGDRCCSSRRHRVVRRLLDEFAPAGLGWGFEER